MRKITSIMMLLMIAFAPLITIAQDNASVIASKDVAIVQTESGKVKGYIHNGIYTYKGIPYAKAGRFMAPSKPDAWSAIRSSMSYGPVCPTDPTTSNYDAIEFPFQHDWGYTNENCLCLNVWAKQINDNKKRPVMVWLHGGGFTAGSSIELPSYDGENLTKKGDVVVVSINHRLNILGFLDLSAYGDKYKSSPDAGLLDIISALQWVKDNIAQFGGDPENVTIFGQSGGGGKVTCLMNSPLAKGLFQKAIVESGSYINEFMDPSISKQVAAALLQELNLQSSQVDSLKNIPYDVLNAAGKKALTKVQNDLKASGKPMPMFGLGWGPILDETVLPYQPTETAAKDLSKNIPLLVGTTKNEFTPFMPASKDTTMEQLKTSLQKRYGDKTDAYIAAVKKAYPNTVNIADYTAIDLNFRSGAIAQANLKATSGDAPVYMYLFAWQSPVNDGIYKAMHCMDIAFQFDNIARCQEMTGGGKDAYGLADKVSSAWLNFARTGNPNAKGLPDWPKYTPDNGATMIFDNKCEVKNAHDKDLLAIAASK